MTWMDSGSILSWAFTNQGGGRGGQNKNNDMYFSQMLSTICPQQLLAAQCDKKKNGKSDKKMAKGMVHTGLEPVTLALLAPRSNRLS